MMNKLSESHQRTERCPHFFAKLASERLCAVMLRIRLYATEILLAGMLTVSEAGYPRLRAITKVGDACEDGLTFEERSRRH